MAAISYITNDIIYLLLFLLVIDATKSLSMMIPSTLSRHSFADGYNIILQSTCNCGKVIIDISLPADVNLQKNVWNCHCESCRRYHTAAYTSFVKVSEDQIHIHQGQENIGKSVSSCQSLEGAAADDSIERCYCIKCSSKLLSKDKYNDCYWVNLGPIKEDTIPKTNANRWKKQLQQIENNIHTDNSSCKWLHALPDSKKVKSKTDSRQFMQSGRVDVSVENVNMRFQLLVLLNYNTVIAICVDNQGVHL